MAKLICQLRKYRKSARLSQRELALLLGLKSQGSFSELEAGLKGPSAAVLLASEIVFGIPARELFPGIYARSTRTVRGGLRRLRKSAGDETRASSVGPGLARRAGPRTAL